MNVNNKEAILELVKLSKQFRSHWTYKPIRAVEEVSLCVYRGDAFGFLGHNGAGKTTTLKCITGLIRPSAGEIIFQKKPLCSSSARNDLGYLPEQPYFYDHLTIDETLDFFAALHGCSGKERRRAVDAVLEEVGLVKRRRDRVRSLSKGWQQRLGIAQAIINRPSLLLLDEPFSGLDPLGRAEIGDLIGGLQDRGTTIFMSSHILSDIEDICNRVAFLADGSLQKVLDLSESNEFMKVSYELRLIDAQGDTKISSYTDYEQASIELSSAISANCRVLSFQRVVPSLTDVFIRITTEARTRKGLSATQDESESRTGVF